MDPAEILYEFAAGEMSQPTRGQIMIDGRTLNADILAFGTDVSITVPKGVNNPTAERALIQRLGERKKKKDWTDIEIKLSFGKHRIEDALAGWLRSAYLAVFSAWGYSYILRPQLDAVREQIQRPDSNVLKVFSFSMPSPAFDEAHIALIDRPQSLAGHLLVVMERHAIFLPGLPDRDLYGELARQSEAGMEANVSAKKEVPWPVRPRFELDFAPSSDN